MDYRTRSWLPHLLGSGLLLGILGGLGCNDTSTAGSSTGSDPTPDVTVLKGSTATALLQAKDCPDLLTKIQDDAVMKVKLAVALAKERGFDYLRQQQGGYGYASHGVDQAVPPSAVGADGAGALGGASGAPSPSVGNGETSNAGSTGTGSASSGGSSSSSSDAKTPTSASGTNTQVAGVDEADFVKVVNNGKAMFLLHGNTLRKLKSWPADQTSLDPASLTIEGYPSEMFVTDDGKAVVFSSVNGYGRPGTELLYGTCTPVWCYGSENFTKITIADVSGDTFKTERELYYEGSYLSSRRYEKDSADVVRVVLEATNTYAGLYTPQIEWSDAWGRPYADDVLSEELDAWAVRTENSIRNTKLSDWLPLVQEAKGGKLVDVDPACDQYFVPQAGLSAYGLTHVLSVDISKPDAPIGGVTIVGAAQTVYSNLERMVLAQPDYRWIQTSDFGYVDEQRTALHVFALSGSDTKYQASGWVPGTLPGSSDMAQFAIDEASGVVRVATSGLVRDNPKLAPSDENFWKSHPENRVITLKADGERLSVTGKTDAFGDAGDTLQAARFVGDRAYAVTYLNVDPLYVVDVSKAESPQILGHVKIPGFSQYMHPLDDDHLITLGNSGTRGAQLQLFDVSDATQPRVVDTLDYGSGSSSQGQYDHKAFTFYPEKSLIALPLYSSGNGSVDSFGSTLRVIKVDAKSGFKELGAIDHSSLYMNQVNGCVQCYPGYCDVVCYQYNYSPEVRRGHFVSSGSNTYVYSFSYAGVLVDELANLTDNLASVPLPAPQWDYNSWYGTGVNGSTGSTKPGVGIALPGMTTGGAPAPEPAIDAGAPTPPTPLPTDAGVAMQP